MNQHNDYLVNSFATAGETLMLGIGQKGLFLQIATFQIFFCNASQPFWFTA